MVHVVRSKDAKVPPRIQLDPTWRPPRDPATGKVQASGKLWEFTEKIASSRREGKNRRDGATVSSRVLRLTDILGQKMFDEAEAGERSGKGKAPTRLSKDEEETLSRAKREARRRRKLEARPNL